VFYVLRRHDFGARASDVFDTRQTTAIKFLNKESLLNVLDVQQNYIHIISKQFKNIKS
jgi:hypothetical protein